MKRALSISRAGPGMTLQDSGRPGWLDVGLSRGGAADKLALAEGAALLGQRADLAAIEMVGLGGEFVAHGDLRIALTGAPMTATIEGQRLAWNASHFLPAGARLSIGATQVGNYGYLHVGGGVVGESLLGSRSAHLSGDVGRLLNAGDRFEIDADPQDTVGMILDVTDRFSGGTIRVVESFQSSLFALDERKRFEATAFSRDARANRMGVQLTSDAEGFHSQLGRTVLSEVVVPGDIQITGDGTPFVLLSECQTTGGYPRIATVLPCDLPKMAQAGAGARLRFQFVSLEDALALQKAEATAQAALGRKIRPLIRDPHMIPDLLSYQLISGVVSGDEE